MVQTSHCNASKSTDKTSKPDWTNSCYWICPQYPFLFNCPEKLNKVNLSVCRLVPKSRPANWQSKPKQWENCDLHLVQSDEIAKDKNKHARWRGSTIIDLEEVALLNFIPRALYDSILWDRVSQWNHSIISKMILFSVNFPLMTYSSPHPTATPPGPNTLTTVAVSWVPLLVSFKLFKLYYQPLLHNFLDPIRPTRILIHKLLLSVDVGLWNIVLGQQRNQIISRNDFMRYLKTNN